MSIPICCVELSYEQDVVEARRVARELARALHFDAQDGTRIATAVSEMARNAFSASRGGSVEFFWVDEIPQALEMCIREGGIPLSSARDATESALSAQEAGGVVARRLVDSFQMDAGPGGGSVVTLQKRLPRGVRPPNRDELLEAAGALHGKRAGFYEEVRQQNRELLQALDENRQKQEALTRLNGELEETNRGVVALYAELDERAARLREADETKSRFLSHMSHEFRTPLNGIIGLTRLLLANVGRDEEDIRQLKYIQRSAEELTDLVNDLLDLAKVEAGKLTVVISQVEVGGVFGALRGMFRPLATQVAVQLLFHEPSNVPAMETDETKLAQVLRNFVSNALKFTEQGEVVVSCVYTQSDDSLRFSVRDTGIGIPEVAQSRIFEEFTQVENPLQKRSKGTGLGLALCKKLAGILGGRIEFESKWERGSTFSLILPRVYAGEIAATANLVERVSAERKKMLLIDDEEISRYLLRHILSGDHDLLEATTGEQGLLRAKNDHPDVVFLDLRMPDVSGLDVLTRLRNDQETASIPVVVITAQELTLREQKVLAEESVTVLPKGVLARANTVRVDFGPPLKVNVDTATEVIA